MSIPGDDWNDDDGRTSEEQLADVRESFCQHEETRINLSTCTIQCLFCDEHLISLDFMVSKEMRVTQ